MKENSQRRDPESPSGGGVTNGDIRVDRENRAEREAEARRDARLRTDASRRGDEQVNAGRREAESAGGNGEQRSRELARVKSVAVVDFEEGPAPFVKQESADHETPADAEGDAERNAESAVAASGKDKPSTTGANADPRTRRQDAKVTGSGEKTAEINRPSSPSRTSNAPFSQSGARVSDFEGAGR